MSDPAFGSALISQDAITYRPMPPVQGFDANGAPATERIVNVGLAPKPGSDDFQHEIVGVNLGRKSIVRYSGRAPRTAYAVNQLCGVRPAGQSTTRRGTAGQYQLTVTDTDGTVLWDMLVPVIRPLQKGGNRRLRGSTLSTESNCACVVPMGTILIWTEAVLLGANAPLTDGGF